jgi:hypothetical protein
MPCGSRATLLAVTAATCLLGGCLRQYQPAKPGSVLDTTCEGPTRPGADWVVWQIPEASFAAPPNWRLDRREATEVTLRRVDGELSVWSGSRWVFPVAEPWQSVRCTIARGGDTTLTVQTTRLGGRLAYRVDVTVEPLIEGRYVYLQLQTSYVEHLRDVRAILTSLRFGPADTAGIATRRPAER